VNAEYLRLSRLALEIDENPDSPVLVAFADAGAEIIAEWTKATDAGKREQLHAELQGMLRARRRLTALASDARVARNAEQERSSRQKAGV
jgi:hypothetical protein